MLLPVSTIAKKLVSFVQSGPLLRPHNVVYFCQAEATDLGGGIEGGGPSDNVPGGGVWDI